MFPMLKGSALNSRISQPAFFVPRKGNGFEMHFSTKLLNQHNMYENNYNILHFKPDFEEILRDYGRPHFPTVRSALKAWKDECKSNA